MNARTDRLLDAVLAASAAVSESGRWGEMLALLARHFGATAVALHTVGEAIEERGLVAGFQLPPDIWANYAGGWHAQDPWVAALHRRHAGSGEILIGREVCDWSVLERTDYFHGFCIPHGLRSLLALVIDGRHPASQGTAALLCLYRRPGLEEFSHDDRRQLQRMHQPLRLALQAHRALADARRHGQVAADALSTVPKALLVLDLTGRVLHANAPAETMLADERWIGTHAGRLVRLGRLGAEEVCVLLRRAVAGLLQTHVVWSDAHEPDPVQACAVLRWMPIAPHNAVGLAWPGARVLLLVDRLDNDMADRRLPMLARRHGLTPAETRVLAELAQGARPAEIAQHLGVSIHTVRAHLRQLFDKTGSRRQAELVRLVGMGLQLPD